jgi:hypothetical protein
MRQVHDSYAAYSQHGLVARRASPGEKELIKVCEHRIAGTLGYHRKTGATRCMATSVVLTPARLTGEWSPVGAPMGDDDGA